MVATTAIPFTEIPDNSSPDICSGCTSVCCENLPCETWPMDVSRTVEGLTEAIVEKLKTGLWAIDWWEGDVDPDAPDEGGYRRSMYLRPAVAGNEHRLEDASWGGACTFYTPGKGCELSWQERPTGGKGLVPHEDYSCYSLDIDGEEFAGKYNAARAWRPFQQHITEAIAIVRSAQATEDLKRPA